MKWMLEVGAVFMRTDTELLRTACAQNFAGKFNSYSVSDKSHIKDLLMNLRRLLLYRKKTSVPTLTIHGALEGTRPQRAFAGTPSAFTGSYLRIEIPEAGHFVHLEAPERVNAEILKYLGPAGAAE